MKEWIAKYQKAIVGTGAVSVLLICFLQQKELGKLRAEVKEVKRVSDSLRSEDFIKFTKLSRYELTMEHLKEVNPKIGGELEYWMLKNTE